MLALINNLLDRCFFTITFILGVQLPEFMQQYQQRLAGHLNEAQLQLSQFTVIAQQHFDGNLITMITRYKNNSEASIVSTGEVIERLSIRVEYLTVHLEQLQSTDYLNSIYQFIWYLDKKMAVGTAEDFSMAIPLELHAIATGATLAIASLLLKEFLMISFSAIFKAKQFN